MANQTGDPGSAPFFLAAAGGAFFWGVAYVLGFNPREYGTRMMRFFYSASPHQVPDRHSLIWRTRLFAAVYFLVGAAVETIAVLGFLGKFPPS
ncbi:hypothetical protein [Streptomyces sp. TRM68367]|uniref:hypothetical protein n=1 Tax=Streptomyces sp. TRM68367 TaxID=2758415 RepID=UPI00165AA761|nr:hypothetical protein [Streptomyces sp. TRM68367]MBC9724422.1 hypothetical protein [Streptomyces sp. TRM68367]